MSDSAAKTNTYYDVITSFEQGVNSGITPILLPKNQLAFALNATVRGGNVAGRPPVQIQTLNFGGDEALEIAVLKGFFQGAGTYRPDSGPTQIIAQISGRLFAFTPNSVDWVVTEISVPGDLNDPTIPQVWMWQSEKWLIIQNGSVFPIIYDGVTSRRSRGPSRLLGTATALLPVAPPAIGEQVSATLTAPWTEGFDIPVIFNGAFYQTKATGVAPYYVKLTKIFAQPSSSAVTPIAGQIINSRPSYIGPTVPFAHSTYVFTLVGSALHFPHVYQGTETIQDLHFPVESQVDTRVAIGDSVTMVNKTWTVTTINSPTSISVTRNTSPTENSTHSLTHTDYQTGTPAYLTNNTSPFTYLGTSAGIVSSVGDEYIVGVDIAYTGPEDAVVWVGNINAGYYTIGTAPPPAPSATLILVNLSDTDTANYLTAPHDGSIRSVPELPAGRMGAYGMGRNWLSLVDGISYVASDIVGGAAGTQASNYRDSVLSMTENDFLSGGGSFRLPGSGNVITSMTFIATLDASQGQGALMIGTDSGFFSNNTPTDRDTWQNLTNPILTEAMIGAGPLAQNSTISVNSDILFRCVDGLGSLVIARKNFNQIYSWGNTPISREMDPTFRADNPNLLIFGSAVSFDNRMLTTVSPTPNGAGTYHRGVVALNFDTISSLTNKSNPVYDGLWTGLNILQFLGGNFSGTGRAFAFSYDLTSSTIQLYEILTTIGGKHFDNGDTRVKWIFESPVMFNRDVKPMSELVRLLDGEMYAQDVDGRVNLKVEYRPDFYPCWETWTEFEICADRTITDGKPGYRTRLSMGDPPSDNCDAANNNRLLRVGHFFQFRFTFTGYLKFMGFRAQATTDPAADFQAPVCSVTCLDTIPLPQ